MADPAPGRDDASRPSNAATGFVLFCCYFAVYKSRYVQPQIYRSHLLLTALPIQFAVPSFSVPSDQCVAPTLDYSALTTAGLEGGIYIYTMSPFTSSCSGRVVGYWFCYQNTNTITGVRVNISTVVLLEDMGDNYQVVGEFNVMAEPDRDCCPFGSSAGRQYCVSRNLTAERQFGVNSSYLYGVVDLPGGPDMIQTHVSVGRRGYQFNPDAYTQMRQMGNKLMKQGDPSRQPLRMFQFIIGEFRFAFVHSPIDQTMSPLVFQKIWNQLLLLPQHPLVTHIPPHVHLPVPHLPVPRLLLTLPPKLKLLLSPLTLPQAPGLHLP